MASLLCNLPNHQERNAQCRAVAVIQCIIHQITDITLRKSSKQFLITDTTVCHYVVAIIGSVVAIIGFE